MIFTFYSYKGGVGRSMALANLASWFFLQGARVVAIDWDLEAPGLEAFFYQSEPHLDTVRARDGLMDLLLAYRQEYMAAARTLESRDTAGWHRAAVAKLGPIERWLHPVHELEPKVARAPGLWLLTAGRRHDRFADYAESVHDFDWAGFYADYEGEAFFEWLRQELAPTFDGAQLTRHGYSDVVLIDSRTGITEMGGVCTQQLADVVVAFCAPNLQNLLGVEAMARSFRRAEILDSRNGKPDVVIVPSRVDASELESRNRFQKRLQEMESEFIPPALQMMKRGFWDLRIPYVPRFTYEEALSIRVPAGQGRYIEAEEMASAYRLLGATMVLLTPPSHALRSYTAQDTASLFDRKRVYLAWAGFTGTSVANAILRKLSAEAPDIDLWLQQGPATASVSGEPTSPELPPSFTYLIAVSPEALESDSLRQQCQQARRNGACVYGAYTGSVPSLLPPWLRRIRLFDVHADWNQLLQTLRGPCAALRAPFMPPPLPERYVERPQVLARLRQAVLAAPADSHTIVLRGMGGSGKSVLAAALCHESEVVDRFDGGILWLTLGRDPQLRECLTQLYAALTGDRPAFANVQDAAYHLTVKLDALHCLIVLDDVWSAEDASAFFPTGPRSTWLITTRNAAVAPAATVVPVEMMTLEESVRLLVGQMEVSYTPLSLKTVASELGGFPLAVTIARNLLLERVQQGDALERASARLLEQLRRRGLQDFDPVRATVEASVSRLPEVSRRRFFMLEALSSDERIPVSDVAELWGLEPFDADNEVQQMARLSLLEFDAASGTLTMHPIIRSYLRTERERAPSVARNDRSLAPIDIRALAVEMEQLLAERERFATLKPVVDKIDRRVAEIEALLQGEP